MTRDTALHQCGWKQANQLWNLAAMAAGRCDFALHDRLMIEFRSISDTWESTTKGPGRGNSHPEE